MSLDDDTLAILPLRPRAGADGGDVLERVEAYWHSLRGDRLVPLRGDLDPGRIDGALPHAFILERVGPGAARMRVAGQALSRRLGADARGVPLSAFFSAAARPRVREALDRMFDDPAIVELPLLCGRGAFRQPLKGRLLILPLLGPEGICTRALGALAIEGPEARSPRQFDLDPGGRHRCEAVPPPRRGLRQIAAMHAAPALAPVREPRPDALTGLRALPSATPLPAVPTRAGRPHLRLVVSNV